MHDLSPVISYFGDITHAIELALTSIWSYFQIGLVAAAAVVGAVSSLLLRKRLDLLSLTMGLPAAVRLLLRSVTTNLGVIVFALLMILLYGILRSISGTPPSYLVEIAAKLGSAWVLIDLVASVIHNKFIFRAVALSAWIIAALSIVGALGHVTAALDSVALHVGNLRISPLLIIETSVLLLASLWLATIAANFLEDRVRRSTDLTPAIRLLIGKLIRLFLIALAILMVLSAVGIDLSALAFFSGAVGVGLGFGLQKIVSNLVSGIILLADKSIKPGDVVTVADSFGWIDTMGARYTSVVTRDGREFLIPNEDLVTQRVINWSHSNDRIRLEVNFGVAYDSDPHVVRRFAAQVAATVPRVLAKPEPICHLTGFGASSLDFVLRFWICDPANGITNVRGTVMLGLWDAFKREGIGIPYQVRDLRIGAPVSVVIEKSPA